MTKESTKDKKNQFDRFKDAAKEHECDEDEKAFDDKLKKIAEQKPRNKEN